MFIDWQGRSGAFLRTLLLAMILLHPIGGDCVGVGEEIWLGLDGRVGEDWWRGEQVVVADYTITIENVGDNTFSPVNLQNVFPAETAFMGSSVRPVEQTADYASWTLTHLSPGDTSTITLRLLVSPDAETLIDKVYAEGEYPGGSARADNISVMGDNWLSCP